MDESARNGSLFEPILKNLDYLPIPGWPNASLVTRKPEAEIEAPDSSYIMTAADWDKFERDIADAFERVDEDAPGPLG